MSVPIYKKGKPNSERTDQSTLTGRQRKLLFQPHLRSNTGLVRTGVRDFSCKNSSLGPTLRSGRKLSRVHGPRELGLPQGDYFLGQDPGEPNILSGLRYKNPSQLLQLEQDLKVAVQDCGQ